MQTTISVDGEDLIETHCEPGDKQEPTRYKHEGDYIISVRLAGWTCVVNKLPVAPETRRCGVSAIPEAAVIHV
jgi:hypothetical protein